MLLMMRKGKKQRKKRKKRRRKKKKKREKKKKKNRMKMQCLLLHELLPREIRSLLSLRVTGAGMATEKTPRRSKERCYCYCYGCYYQPSRLSESTLELFAAPAAAADVCPGPGMVRSTRSFFSFDRCLRTMMDWEQEQR